jgi:pimeloyl-ACP methyl ester carboxylesterase
MSDLARRRFFAAALVAGLLPATSTILAQAQTDEPGLPRTGYAPVNGLNLYYEIHGSGSDVQLILLHGALGAAQMFSDIMPLLSKNRRVVAVEMQAHGHSTDVNRPLTIEGMAEDVTSLIEHLKVKRADLMGYSMGGGIALRVAIRHPDVVRRMVVVPVPFKRDGWYPEIITAMEQMGAGAANPMKQTSLYRMYANAAPRPSDWPVLLAKVGELVRKDYDWSKELSLVKASTLIVIGDADAVRTGHAVEFFEHLGGGKGDGGWDGSGMSRARLAILPSLTHYNIFSSSALAATVTQFLDSHSPGLR